MCGGGKSQPAQQAPPPDKTPVVQPMTAGPVATVTDQQRAAASLGDQQATTTGKSLLGS